MILRLNAFSSAHTSNLQKFHLTSISVGKHRITVLDDIRNLGAYFDKNLSMKTHVDAKCTAAFHQLY